MTDNKKFSWMGLLFGPHYYAGYGKLGKGLGLAALSGFPLFAIFVAIYCGRKANAELPVGETDFKWPPVAATVVLQIAVGVVLEAIINGA